MVRAIRLCIFLGVLFPLSLCRSDEENLKKLPEYLKKDTCLTELSVLRSYLREVEESLKALEQNNQNSSVPMTAKELDGLSSAISHNSNNSAEGIITTQEDGIVAISLPSLEQSKISRDIAFQVALDHKAKKVYWLNKDSEVIRANLDGTDVEILMRENVGSFALDPVTGNIYYQNFSSFDMIVCSREGEKCSVVASNQNAPFGIAVYPSKSLVFWFNRTSLVRANMDGTNATVILSKSLRRLYVDKDRVYWISRHCEERLQVGSCDLNGQNVRVLLDTTSSLSGMEVDGDRLYFADREGKSIHSISTDGGEPALIATTTARISDIALYGNKADESGENPCESSPCSHLCVLKLESFACLCPEGDQLDQDGVTCI